jgi:hypothetical protein
MLRPEAGIKSAMWFITTKPIWPWVRTAALGCPLASSTAAASKASPAFSSINISQRASAGRALSSATTRFTLKAALRDASACGANLELYSRVDAPLAWAI